MDRIFVKITKHITICLLVDKKTNEVKSRGVALCSLTDKPDHCVGKDWALMRAQTASIRGENSMPGIVNAFIHEGSHKVRDHLENNLEGYWYPVLYKKAHYKPTIFTPQEMKGLARYYTKKVEGVWENR